MPPQTDLCWRAELSTSHLTWQIFVLLVFYHGSKGTAPPRLLPPAQPFPAPAPTFQGRAVGTGNWERPGCTWQCLGAEGGCRITTPWRGLTLARPRRAGHRAEPAPRCCPASHAAFILVLWQVAWSRLISTSCLKSISGLFASFYL